MAGFEVTPEGSVKKKAQAEPCVFCIRFSENSALLSPAKAHCFAGSGAFRRKSGRGSRRALPSWRCWGCNQPSKMGQIESSTVPKLCRASAGRSFLAAIQHLFSCYPAPPFQINHALPSDFTSPPQPTRPLSTTPTASGCRILASPPLEICRSPSLVPAPSAGVASATSATAA